MATDETSSTNRRQLQEGAIKGAIWTLLHTTVSLPVAFLANLFIARVLGAADYGRLAFLAAITDVVVVLSTLGFSQALVQFGAKDHAAGRQADVRRLLSAAQGFRLLVAAPVLALFVATIARVDTPLLIMALIFGVGLPAALDGATACMWIENKSAQAAKVSLTTALFVQVVAVTTLFIFRSVDAVWVSRLMANGLGVALGLVVISKDYRKAVLRPALPRGIPKAFWKFAVLGALAVVLSELVMSRSEIFIMNWLSTPASVGIFALAFGLAHHLFVPTEAFRIPLVPAISGLREVDAAAVAPAFNRSLRAGATIVGVFAATFLAPVALLIPLLYGSDFSTASSVFVALGISSGFVVVAMPVTAFVSSRLRASELLAASVLALVVDVALALSLIPLLDVWGAVIANVGAVVTHFCVLLRWEIRLLGLSWVEVVSQSVPAIFGSVLAAGVWIGAEASALEPLPAAVGCAALGLVLLLGCLRLSRTGLTPEDAAAFLRPLGGRLRRPANWLLPYITHRRPTRPRSPSPSPEAELPPSDRSETK